MVYGFAALISGHPQAGRVTVATWTFNLPSDAFQCVKISDNVFETTLYLVKDFQFKFYKQRPWGGELASTTVNPYPINLLGKGWFYSDPATVVLVADILPVIL